VHDGCFLADPGELARAFEQFVVDDQGRPHMHEYETTMHMSQTWRHC
jgi:hypothetical protein